MTLSAARCVYAGGRDTTCEANDGAIHREPCDRSSCPVDCVGHWGEWECSVSCGSGGRLKRTYFITQQPRRGGLSTTCEAEAGAEQFAPEDDCNADIICPVDCEGSFGDWSECSTKCGMGNETRMYSIAKAAAHGGRENSCLHSNGYTEERACVWYTECPIGRRSCTVSPYGCLRVCNLTSEFGWCLVHDWDPDCVGMWSAWSNCSSTCGPGTKSKVYTVSVAAAFGGNEESCEAFNGAHCT